MATWGLHMRIAESILNKGFDLDKEYFLVGNIGVDCGVPNEDWSEFTPHTDISHWSRGGKSRIEEYRFRDAHLTNINTDIKKKSFLIGYYVHLLTDKSFVKLFKNKREKDINYKPLDTDSKFIWKIKEDWYDLDHKYFRDNPDNIFNTTFKHVKNFPDYMDYYPKGAVQRQVEFITEYYLNPSENLDREYKYLTEEEMNNFLDESTTEIIENLTEYNLI